MLVLLTTTLLGRLLLFKGQVEPNTVCLLLLCSGPWIYCLLHGGSHNGEIEHPCSDAVCQGRADFRHCVFRAIPRLIGVEPFPTVHVQRSFPEIYHDRVWGLWFILKLNPNKREALLLGPRAVLGSCCALMLRGVCTCLIASPCAVAGSRLKGILFMPCL